MKPKRAVLAAGVIAQAAGGGFGNQHWRRPSALRCGLVNEVYPDHDSLLEGARAMAQEIAANSPLAVQGVKQVLRYSEEHTIEDGLEYVAQWNSSFLHSQDLVEAMKAFMEKRPPQFTGR